MVRGGWKKIHSWCLSLSYLNPFWHNLTYGKNSGRIFYALVMNGLKHCASHNVSVNVNQPVYLRNHVSFFSQLLDTEIPLTLRVLWVKQLSQSRKWRRDFTSFWCKRHFSVLPKNIRPSTNLVFSISGTQTWWLIIIVLSRSLIYDGDYWHDFAETVFCTSSLDLSGYSDQDHPVRR